MSKKKTVSKKLIAIIVAVALAIIIIPSAIYCIVEGETPVQMVTDLFSSSEKQLVGKWQGDTGVSAYEFYEDGSYDSYLSTFSFSGKYYIEGNKLTLTNPANAGKVVYKVKATEKTLVMTLIEENGMKPEEKEKQEFERVSHINTKTLNDLVSELKEELNEQKDAE